MLIREGGLTQVKIKNGKEKEIYVFLFSDALMVSVRYFGSLGI